MRRHRNEPLRLHAAGIRAAAPAGVLIDSLLDDLGTEFFRGVAQRLGIKLVFRMRPLDQEPAFPLLPHEILGKTVGEHGMTGRDVNDIGATIFFPKKILGRAGIENKDPLVLRGIGEREKRGRRKIGKNKRDAMRDKAVQRGDRIIARIETDVLDRKALAYKPARCVVVLDGEFRTGNAIVGGWNIEDRESSLAHAGHE